MEKKIQCACGDQFSSKKGFIFHILTLGCFDEDLLFKDKEVKA